MGLEGKTFRHYHIRQLIGKGGMGEVYLLEDLRVQRQVAAKFIYLEGMSSSQEATDTLLHLFWREATAIARLDHPNILPLYDHGEELIAEIAVAYLIMPYRPDGSLIAWLRQRARDQKTRSLTLQQIAYLIKQASQSLQYAHDHQVMHLDVKPANFLIQNRSMLNEAPNLLLSDFGIARLASTTTHSSINVRGTATYMAPEQWNGQPTFASDQYALAIMAYELLTGHPPFQGSPMSVMYAHAHTTPPAVHEQNPLVPASVDPVLQRALAKRPEERFPTIADFADAFGRAFWNTDERTTLRILQPSPPLPAQGSTVSPSAGDIRATLAVSVEEARRGTLRLLTLANGRRISVQIPADAQDQQLLLLPGQGEIPGPGASAGNLYLTLSVVEAPEKISSDEGETDLLQQDSQPAQASSLMPPFVPGQQQIRLPVAPGQQQVRLPTVIEADSDTSEQTDYPFHQPVVTLSPVKLTPGRKKRRPVLRILLVVALIALLAGGTIYGGNTGRWPWNVSQWAWLTHNLNGVAWSDAGAQFVAVGSGSIIVTSPDGHSWTGQNSNGSTANLNAITWSGKQFVAVGDNEILTSPDGYNWTGGGVSPVSADLNAIAWSGKQFVAVGNDASGEGAPSHAIILTSPDAQTWAKQNVSVAGNLTGITWSGKQFVAVGYDPDKSSGMILTSPDGQNWTNRYTGVDQNSGIAWSGKQFVVVGYDPDKNSGTLLTSPDGQNWTNRSVDSSSLNSIVWSGKQFVAVGESSNIVTSPDGSNWTSWYADGNHSLTGVAWSGQSFIAVGNNIVFSSLDGQTWTTA